MDRLTITPDAVALGWRLAGVLVICVLWVEQQGHEAGIILVLILAILALARWRFSMPAWTTLVDQTACALGALIWPGAAFAFVIPMFDSCLAFRPLFALPALVALAVLRGWSVPMILALVASSLAGFTILLWTHQLRDARQEADSDRRRRYELESIKNELLSANVRVARMAEASERARIARDLHDHAGHEITAAQLALDAFRRIWREDSTQANRLLEQASSRVACGMDLLRRTARGMSPESPVGAVSLEEICRSFTACDVSFSVHGDTNGVPIHAWGVLESCTKEALTNVARHEASARIDVSLDVGAHIVRLSVCNPTRGHVEGGWGYGLRNLSERARAVGGSVTTDTRDGFRFICVLPLDEVKR